VLLGMKATQANANRWDGQIYNSENGKTYTGNISLSSPDVLRVEGCLLIFCGGQDWARVKAGATTTGRAGQPTPPPRTAGAAPTGGKAASPATQTAQEVCANVSRRMSSAASP
jgi:hypothetical protein